MRFPLRSLAIAVLLAQAIAGCKDEPTPPSPPTGGGDSVVWGASLLTNGNFATPVTGTQDIDQRALPGWRVGSATPQICPLDACDGIKGALQMWGNATLGESVVQMLPTPIRKGHTYRVSACVMYMNDNPQNYTPHVKVRFVAFNSLPESSNFPQSDPPNVAVIGSLKTSSTSFTPMTTGEWVADADYAGFMINVENETPDDGTPNTVSWARIDDVKLQEKVDLY